MFLTLLQNQVGGPPPAATLVQRMICGNDAWGRDDYMVSYFI